MAVAAVDKGGAGEGLEGAGWERESGLGAAVSWGWALCLVVLVVFLSVLVVTETLGPRVTAGGGGFWGWALFGIDRYWRPLTSVLVVTESHCWGGGGGAVSWGWSLFGAGRYWRADVCSGCDGGSLGVVAFGGW